MPASSPNPVRSILVVGGGSAGWMAAAWLGQAFKGSIRVELVESDEIGTVGVGEATIPGIRIFNRTLGLNEAEFVRATGGTFKLGIEFLNWGRLGHRYFHPFGNFGNDFDRTPVDQYWLRLSRSGKAPSLDDMAIADAAAKRGRFALPGRRNPKARSRYDYAYHFDAGLYAAHLRQYAERQGVVRHEGRIVDVAQDPGNGHVRSVKLQDGRELSADLFIDCSGFRALLIEDTMKSGFEDWSHWLPCDRALAVPTERGPANPTPFTRSTAQEAGWQWRIPLQHRTGNGHVFVSALSSEERAAEVLLASVDTRPLAEPRLLKFKAGMRKSPWLGNVVSLGLAAGFLEPLESTSIYLVHSSLQRLLAFFPNRDFDPLTIDEFNRVTRIEWEHVRDFIVLHYCATERSDTELWKHCASMEVPESLQRRIDQYRRSGLVVTKRAELFQRPSWFAVLNGQLVEPAAHHPLADVRPEAEVAAGLREIADWSTAVAEKMPTHADFIERHCKAPFAA